MPSDCTYNQLPESKICSYQHRDSVNEFISWITHWAARNPGSTTLVAFASSSIAEALSAGLTRAGIIPHSFAYAQKSFEYLSMSIECRVINDIADTNFGEHDYLMIYGELSIPCLAELRSRTQFTTVSLSY